MTEHFKNKPRFLFSGIFLVTLFVTANWQINSVSASSIESLAQEGLLKSQNMAASEESGNNIPNYSKENADIHANDVDQMDDAEMKSKSHQKMQSADSNSPEGITRDSMNKKTIEGYENQEIFTKAENINDDPIAAFERMTNEGCKEKENEQRQQYKKVVKKEKVTDIEIYEETCERPAGNVVCEKTLSVNCRRLEDCGYDAGGIVGGSIDGNIYWKANYPSLYLGTIDKVRDSGRCHLMDKNINFTVKDRSAVKEFRVTNIQYSDWIRISVNGVQVHNDTGGNGSFSRKRSWHGGYGEFTDLYSGSVTKTCNTKRFYNTNPNVNLLPHLRDGNNTIRIELAFGNSGRLYVELRATQYCCREFNDKWEKRCWVE